MQGEPIRCGEVQDVNYNVCRSRHGLANMWSSQNGVLRTQRDDARLSPFKRFQDHPSFESRRAKLEAAAQRGLEFNWRSILSTRSAVSILLPSTLTLKRHNVGLVLGDVHASRTSFKSCSRTTVEGERRLGLRMHYDLR
jgi:hypothetical protein